MVAKRHELNAKMVSEKAPERRAAMHAQRNVMASMQARAEKAKMHASLVDGAFPATQSTPPASAGPAGSAQRSQGSEAEGEGLPKATASTPSKKASEPRTVKPPKKRRRKTAAKDEL